MRARAGVVGCERAGRKAARRHHLVTAAVATPADRGGGGTGSTAPAPPLDRKRRLAPSLRTRGT